MLRVSRRRVAAAIVQKLEAGEAPKQVMLELAAYLQQHGALKVADKVLTSVEELLAERGHVNATVITTHDLSASLRDNISKYVRDQTGAKDVQLEEKIDESLIGGVIIRTPLAELDASISARLKKFQNQRGVI